MTDMDAIEAARATITAVMPETLPDKVEFINALRRIIHDLSPFRSEPVDLVQWVPADTVRGNAYNPNSVAPPESEGRRAGDR